MISRHIAVLLFLVHFICLHQLVGQILDSDFYPIISSGGGIVYAVAVQPDQKVLIAGEFWEVNGEDRVSITRLNPDGTVDESFLPMKVQSSGLPATIHDIKLQADGKILVVGNFRSVSGHVRNGIARLNTDGSLDTSFQNSMTGVTSSTVNSVALQSNGKIIIGGQFFEVNGVARDHVARLNTDGSLDATFQNPKCSSAVNSVTVQSDDKVIIGGRFTFVHLTSRNKIARLNADGTLDATFLNGSAGADNDVAFVSVQADGRILAGGDFTSVNGLVRNRIVRLNSDGGLDDTFQNGMAGVNDLVNFIEQQADGKILIGGFFTSVNGTSSSKLAILNGDGSRDESFTSSLGAFPDYIYEAIRTPDGKIFGGGSFQNVGGVVRQHFARFDPDGGLDETFAYVYLEKLGGVTEINRQADGKILISGYFRFVNGAESYKLARLNNDGSSDPTFSVGTLFSSPSDYILKIQTLADGKILVAGNFVNTAGRHLARINSDGTADNTFQHQLSCCVVSSFFVQSDGKILIGGNFNFIGSEARNNLARLNADGSLDTSFLGGLSGTNGYVNDILPQPDGKILIVGSFSTVNGTSRNNVARLNADGSLDVGFVVNTTGMVHDVILQPDGKIVLGGYFSSVNGISRNQIARLNSDGSLDMSFLNGLSGTDGEVFEVERQDDGRIIISGRFSHVNGSARRLARLNIDGSLDPSFRLIDITQILDPNTEGIEIEPEGRLLVGGYFSRVDGFHRTSLFRVSLSRSSPFDFDGDGKTDIGIYRPNGTNGSEWWINRSSNDSMFATQFGAATDKVVSTDFTGDGKADVAFWRPSTGYWYVLRSEDLSYFAVPFGANGDIPVPADYDGDGKADRAVFRPSTNTWYIEQSGGGTRIEAFGSAGDKPVPADYDGDGKADLAIFRPTGGSGSGEWWINRSTAGLQALVFGVSTDKPVQGDYTGDGKADIAFWRPSTGEWYVLRSENLTYYSTPFGASTDIPTPGDYDGDGKFDTAVFRPSDTNWYVQRTTAGILIRQFGSAGDQPLPNAFVP